MYVKKKKKKAVCMWQRIRQCQYLCKLQYCKSPVFAITGVSFTPKQLHFFEPIIFERIFGMHIFLVIKSYSKTEKRPNKEQTELISHIPPPPPYLIRLTDINQNNIKSINIVNYRAPGVPSSQKYIDKFRDPANIQQLNTK